MVSFLLLVEDFGQKCRGFVLIFQCESLEVVGADVREHSQDGVSACCLDTIDFFFDFIVIRNIDDIGLIHSHSGGIYRRRYQGMETKIDVLCALMPFQMGDLRGTYARSDLLSNVKVQVSDQVNEPRLQMIFKCT